MESREVRVIPPDQLTRRQGELIRRNDPNLPRLHHGPLLDANRRLLFARTPASGASPPSPQGLLAVGAQIVLRRPGKRASLPGSARRKGSHASIALNFPFLRGACPLP